MPPWLSIARRYIGIKELKGSGSHPAILGWAVALGGWVASWFRDDDTPWCAVFANAVLKEAGYPVSGTGAALVRAKSFATYGTPLDTPALGCILVFERTGGGHVGFYVGETLSHYRVLGGNQGDAVQESWIVKTRCSAMRWPPDAPDPTIGRKFLPPTYETPSENER